VDLGGWLVVAYNILKWFTWRHTATCLCTI